MPIANDLMYGGKIVNDGSGREKEWGEEFEGVFHGEEKEEFMKRPFMMLWLHAYKYVFKGIAVETKTPEWGKADFKVN